jgi:hypothetical protein
MADHFREYIARIGNKGSSYYRDRYEYQRILGHRLAARTCH